MFNLSFRVIFCYWLIVVAWWTRNSPVDEIGERYPLNHAIVVQAAWNDVLASLLQAASCLLTERTSADVTVLFIVV